MPRPTKTTGAPYWSSKSKALNKEQKNDLLELLGIDTDDDEERNQDYEKNIINNIESYLGAYNDLIQATDKAPRPANYLAEIIKLRKDSWDLLQNFTDTSVWLHDLIIKHGGDIYEVQHALARFVDMGTIIINNLESHESRGAPKNNALKILINTLRETFNNFYIIPDIDEKLLEKEDQADNRKLSGREQAEVRFIESCLESGNIPIPNNVRSLFYNSDTAAEDRLLLQRTY